MSTHILTFINHYNYGSVLQAYALNRFINSVGIDSDTIYYDLSFGENIPLKTKIKILLTKTLFFFPTYNRKCKFAKFIRERIKLLDGGKAYKSYNDLEQRCWSEDDVFIVGSDQCWCELNRDEFFLDFVYKKKKIAYGVSMGDCLLEQETIDEIRKKTIDFFAISVREQYHQKQFGNTVSLCIDPVFLLSSKEWINIANIKASFKIPSEYIFVYTIYGSSQMNAFLKNLSKETGLPILLVGGVRKKVNLPKVRFIRDAGLEEWLYLIKNAKFVVTDSFHATAFSILFEKNIFPFSKGKISRIDNLLSYFDLEKIAIHPDTEPSMNIYIDYCSVKQRIDLNDGIVNFSQKWLIDKIQKI